jgi:hypothetical protein
LRTSPTINKQNVTQAIDRQSRMLMIVVLCYGRHRSKIRGVRLYPPDAFGERRLLNSVPLNNSQKTRGSHKPFVIARKLYACAVGADEFDGCQVNGIQRANGSRKRLEGAL